MFSAMASLAFTCMTALSPNGAAAHPALGASRVVSRTVSRADSLPSDNMEVWSEATPALTQDALSRMAKFAKSFAQEPDSIRITAAETQGRRNRILWHVLVAPTGAVAHRK